MNTLSPDLAAKRDRLIELLRSYGSCVVAYSGGLDSTVLAKAAYLALGDRAVAVTGTSASMAAGELDEAKRLAQQIGIRHELVATDELNLAAYHENRPDRCYHCKNELFARVEELARRLDAAVIVDGSNQDDRSDYRPGRRAVEERNVRSPLAECDLTKTELRMLAESWQLPTWDKPATPCLSSRIAYGEPITPERLAMVDRAEQFLRDRGFQPLRVRYHKGDVAQIEVPVEQLSKFADEPFRREVVEHLKSLGFKYVALDLEGFRSGSMNAVLPLDMRRQSDRQSQ
jgi:pyridinium-3,5-biscarboxylic acid mononucleotide sulfurtransferase